MAVSSYPVLIVILAQKHTSQGMYNPADDAY